ncbi:helix-turn-helix domain-containing protein, partial [Gynuella sp.]
MVPECARGLTNSEIAEKLSTSNQTVCKWRNRFV